MIELVVEHTVLFIIALASNLLSALAGGGAGLVQLPALLFLGLPFPMALVTHKIASVALGVGATTKHLRAGSIDWRFSLFILAAGLPGVVIGATSILHLPETLSKIALGILTIGLGLYSVFSKKLGQESNPIHRNITGYAIGGLMIFFIGAINGSLTSGTGLFVTLWLIRWFGLDYKQAVAYTLILVGLFWNGTGALTLSLLTQPRWDWLPALIAGSMIGGYWGAHLSTIKGNPMIKRVFETVTIAVGLSLIAQTLIPQTVTT